MKLKTDEQGHAVVQDGKPVYIKDDGSEIAFDVAGTVATIGRLNGENKSHRERAEAAETKLKGFEGIEDPKKALEALGVVANLDQKKLIDAGEVEKVKAEISKSYQTKLDEATAKSTGLEQQLYAEKVGGAFTRSKYVTEKLSIPPDMVEARFGKHFSIEEGRIVAKDTGGNKLYSQSNPGEPADFDEAMAQLVSQYPYKDSILKGTGASGGGATGNNGSGGGTPKGNLGGTREERLAAIKASMPAGI